MTPREILVGVDDSPNGRAALAWALDLADRLDVRITAVHACGLLDHAAAAHDRFDNEWCAGLRPHDRRLVRDGAPAAVLLAVAAEVDADLIVVGRRGTSGVPGLTLGSTSSEVAHCAPMPVAVIPERAQS